MEAIKPACCDQLAGREAENPLRGWTHVPDDAIHVKYGDDVRCILDHHLELVFTRFQAQFEPTPFDGNFRQVSGPFYSVDFLRSRDMRSIMIDPHCTEHQSFRRDYWYSPGGAEALAQK